MKPKFDYMKVGYKMIFTDMLSQIAQTLNNVFQNPVDFLLTAHIHMNYISD